MQRKLKYRAVYSGYECDNTVIYIGIQGKYIGHKCQEWAKSPRMHQHGNNSLKRLKIVLDLKLSETQQQLGPNSSPGEQ